MTSQTKHFLTIVAAGILLIGSSIDAAKASETVGQKMERGMTKAANAIGKGVEKAGNGIRKGADKAGTGIRKGAEKTGEALGKAGKKIQQSSGGLQHENDPHRQA